MLQAHSFLWHYLWIGPNLFSLALVCSIRRRSVRRQYPIFFAYVIFASLEGFALYGLDLVPAVSPTGWWYAFWVGTIAEGLFKFAVIAELLHHLLHSWPAIAKLGRNVVSVAGVVLVLLAAVAAAFATPDNVPPLVGGAHVLSQTLYLTEAGVILVIFVLASAFQIPWDRTTFGIALGFGLAWSEHLAVWALVTGGVVRNRAWEDLANMATYHACVLIWFYYLLVPAKVATKSAVPLPENNLDVWNRELERLVHP